MQSELHSLLPNILKLFALTFSLITQDYLPCLKFKFPVISEFYAAKTNLLLTFLILLKTAAIIYLFIQ